MSREENKMEQVDNRVPEGQRKEVSVMSARHIDINGYCDCLYTELANMKDSLDSFLTQIELMQGREKGVLSTHVKHLNELIQMIDWKLEIFSKECPVDWNTLGKTSESSASVPTSDSLRNKDFPSGGYAGG